MNPISLLVRIISGEPYRKSTPMEWRWGSGFVACLPIWMALFLRFGRPVFDRVNPVEIWLVMMGGLVVGFLWLYGWARFVPARVSWMVAAAVWLITLSLALTGRI